MEKNNKRKQTKKAQNIKGDLLSSQQHERKNLGKLSWHENWMRTFVLRIFVCFLRHIALVCKAIKTFY